jgi:hypothetical protein
MSEILIGREGNQPFVIGDPDVSRRHAVLTINEATGQMQLKDNNSENGTFIYNGQAFVRLYAGQPYPVTFDTMIQLGPNTRFHIRRLFQQKKVEPQQPLKPEKPEKKTVDISHLRQVSERYVSERMAVESKMGLVNGLRSCSILVSMLAGSTGFIFDSFGYGLSSTQAKLIPIVFAFILMVVLLLLINILNKKLLMRRSKNDHDYAVKYCCPVCHFSFQGKIYENVLAEGSCPKCKTKFYDSRQKH